MRWEPWFCRLHHEIGYFYRGGLGHSNVTALEEKNEPTRRGSEGVGEAAQPKFFFFRERVRLQLPMPSPLYPDKLKQVDWLTAMKPVSAVSERSGDSDLFRAYAPSSPSAPLSSLAFLETRSPKFVLVRGRLGRKLLTLENHSPIMSSRSSKHAVPNSRARNRDNWMMQAISYGKRTSAVIHLRNGGVNFLHDMCPLNSPSTNPVSDSEISD
ncbi:hypothetical protein QBC43DRAFT_6973 [Cladorrhinum sp. PSN259]|nr:hypothetical protein QBC43DRAFT_6973 [Cladorrhinum sp. PSN259]